MKCNGTDVTTVLYYSVTKRESRSGRFVGAKKYLNPLCIEKQAMAFTSLWEVLGGDIVNLF